MRARFPFREPGIRNGFTLLEILIVIVIIGMLVTLVGLSVGVLGRDTEVQDQTKRFWAVLNQAKEEAELLGINLGVIVDQTGYDFVRFDPKDNSFTKWPIPSGGGVLRHFVANKEGTKIYIACSGVNKVGVIEISSR